MMNSAPGNPDNIQSRPQLGATFYPGGVDDFYMPEVVSPLPQRSMPEVPQQIQDNLALLELEAGSVQRHDPMYGEQAPNGSQYPAHHGPQQRTHTSSGRLESGSYGAGHDNGRQPTPSLHQLVEEPWFSPFPKVHNRSPNVPPSAEEKESILEDARVAVLNSNDPEMQLAWAQDALAWVEIAVQNETRLAEIGTPRSSTPRIEHQLRVDAVNVVSFLADQHHPKAEFIRGMWLEFGRFGFRLDKKEAYRSYSRAAQGGYSRAEYRMGMQFENSNDVAKAIQHYQLGVQGGDSASHYRLGMMTLLGQHGQQQDCYRGIEMIKFAAETADENSPQGAYIYGMLQAQELSQVKVPEHVIPLNIDGALFNIEKAAYLGFSKAQTKMGSAYELCQLGCQFDPVLSLHYNNLAARQGEPEAEMAISKWFLSGYEGIFKKNDEMAFTYAQRAAQTGLATAEFALGYFYEVGIHVIANLKEARVWYTRAAENGNKDAKARIEGITRSKTLSRKYHESVAVAKINSVRESRRHSRQERVTMPDVPAIPPIRDSHVAMPDIRPPYQNHQSPHNAPSPAVQRPAYIGPIQSSPNMVHGGFSPSPNVRPVSSATIGGMPTNSRQGLNLPAGTMPPRPFSAMSESGYGGGRGAAAPFVGLGPQISQDNRRASGPMPPVPIDNRRPPTVYDAQQKPLPVVDIGFTAPPDLSGADRKKRPQRFDNPMAEYPPAGRGYQARPERTSSRPTVAAQLQPSPQDGRNHSPYPAIQSTASGHRPPRHESMPIRLGNGLPTQSGPPTHNGPAPQTVPMSKPPVSRPPVPEVNGPAPQSNSTSGGRRPGKGPSTFQEMGVPATKKEEDCTIM